MNFLCNIMGNKEIVPAKEESSETVERQRKALMERLVALDQCCKYSGILCTGASFEMIRISKKLKALDKDPKVV